MGGVVEYFQAVEGVQEQRQEDGNTLGSRRPLAGVF